jgi:hypothetical protein
VTAATGIAALRAWRALPTATRRQVRRLARQHEGHPDPVVAATAVRAARAYPAWFDWTTLAISAALYAVPLVLVLVHRPSSVDGIGIPLLSWFGIVACGGLLALAWTGLTPRSASRTEAANIMRLLADEPVEPAPTAMTVHPRPRRWWYAVGVLAWLLAALGLFLTLGGLGDHPVPWRARLIVALPMAGLIAGMSLLGRAGGLPPWAKRRPWRHDALASLDGEGVAIAYLGVRIPWDGVAGVDVEPAPPSAGASVYVTFRVHDPDAVLASATPPRGRRRQLRQMLDYGEVGLPARWCLETPERIICAAAAQMIAQEPVAEPATAPVSR